MCYMPGENGAGHGRLGLYAWMAFSSTLEQCYLPWRLVVIDSGARAASTNGLGFTLRIFAVLCFTLLYCVCLG